MRGMSEMDTDIAGWTKFSPTTKVLLLLIMVE